jgi:hypothetical protein
MNWMIRKIYGTNMGNVKCISKLYHEFCKVHNGREVVDAINAGRLRWTGRLCRTEEQIPCRKQPFPKMQNTIGAGTKIVPSRSLPMNAVLPCLRQSFELTKREGAPRIKNWQQPRVAASAGVSYPLDLGGTIFVPSTLAEWADLLLGGWKLWKNV